MKNPDMEKTCPDCGSSDIIVVDGPIFCVEGVTRSGICNACGYAWTID